MVPERARVQVGELLTQARKAALERVAGGATESVCLPAEGDMDMDAVVDRERVAHALGALLAYALLRPGASPLGGSAGAQVTMKVRSNPGESAWTLTIVGHGTTPSREALGRLFDPFDTPPSGARAPAGLGLAVGVARRVIELHGGSAQAEPAPEGGLLFRVVLPRLSHSTPVPSVPTAGDVGDEAPMK
jgi:K+-sensing histidine kinase KdpD